LPLSPVDLSALAQRAITFVQPDADSQQIKLNLRLPESEVALSSDADLLQQVRSIFCRTAWSRLQRVVRLNSV